MQCEFSEIVTASEVSAAGRRLQKTASAAERAELATRLGVISVDELSFDVQLTPEKGGLAVTADGRFDASITQACSVTLKPLEQSISMPFFLRFEATEDDAGDDTQMDVDIDDEPPETMIDGTFDIGEMVVQLMALEIDPFPRTPDLPFEDIEIRPRGATATDSDEPRENPFAVLEELKDKLK